MPVTKRKAKTAKPTKMVKTPKAKQETSPVKANTAKRKFGMNKKMLTNFLLWLGVFVVSLVLVDFAVQYLNYKASAAIVNGQRVYMGELNRRLEQTYGKQVIVDLIDETLVRQEATKKNIKITKQQIDSEVKKLEDQFGGKQKLNDELVTRSMTQADLRRQLENSLIIEQLIGKDITVTEDEKKQFFEQYKDMIIPGNANPTYAEAEQRIVDYLKDNKLQEKYQTWIKGIEDKSKIQNNLETPKGISFLGITRSFFQQLFKK